jgi:site-specific recombinase XerD
MSQLPNNKGKKLPAEPLTESEVRSLINACSPRAATGIRNRALLAMLYRSGLRISEALGLYPKDLDANRSTLRVLHGKGDKARVVALDAGAWAIIQVWMERRKSLGISGRSPVFCTLQGESIETAYIRALLPRLSRRAGIEKRVHAHGLRHTHAFELVSEGQPLNVISSQLGHATLATTERYLRHLNPQVMVDAIRIREWSM